MSACIRHRIQLPDRHRRDLVQICPFKVRQPSREPVTGLLRSAVGVTIPVKRSTTLKSHYE